MSTKTELKIIADHLRSSCFLIADGILPSNEGRGYVLRRIMRRAMRQIHKLGAKEAVMHKLVDSLIKEMGDAYPELARARDTIIDSLKNEEVKFRETLGKGLKILEEEIAKAEGHTLSGKIAFKLYDTYGFPLDLTQDILKEKEMEVDEAAFQKEMEEQRNRARKNWTGSGETKESTLFFDLKEKYGETEFLGYASTQEKAKILAIVCNGVEIEEITQTKTSSATKDDYVIILDKTPFYATSGGQKGDDGQLMNADGETLALVSETKKFAGNVFAHSVHNVTSNLKKGDDVIAKINTETRQLRSQNHSATHLMHKALKQVVGNSISQKGSNVDAYYFTFDFNFNRSMTKEEILQVEQIVNNAIADHSSVKTQSMSLEKARETGAEALFGEKYDSEVRVVSMGASVELCGGTHVKNTSEIEAFKIISEKSVASGIRRIEAKTAAGLKDYLNEQAEKLKDLVQSLLAKIDQKDSELSALGETIEKTDRNASDPKILEEILKQKDKDIDRLKKQNLLSGLDGLESQLVADIHLLSHAFDGVDAKDLREIANSLKAKKEFVDSHIFALFGCKNGKVATIIAVSHNLLDRYDASMLIRPVVEAVGGKGGGGKKDLAMGGGVNKDNIVKAVEVLTGLING